jgi:hypothetical protein
VPLLAAMAGAVACVAVPRQWYRQWPASLRQWRQQMRAAGRYMVVTGGQAGVVESCVVWVVVFASLSTRAVTQHLAEASVSLPPDADTYRDRQSNSGTSCLKACARFMLNVAEAYKQHLVRMPTAGEFRAGSQGGYSAEPHLPPPAAGGPGQGSALAFGAHQCAGRRPLHGLHDGLADSCRPAVWARGGGPGGPACATCGAAWRQQRCVTTSRVKY